MRLYDIVSKVVLDYLPINESNLIDVIIKLENEKIYLSEAGAN